MSDKTTTVWVTKYAMSGGIRKEQVVVIEPEIEIARLGQLRYLHKGEYHLTREAAIAKAEEMRTKKIASLKKQIKKLEAMDFTKVK